MRHVFRVALLFACTLLPVSLLAESPAKEAPQPTAVLEGHAVYGEMMATRRGARPLAAVLEEGASDDLQLISGRIGQVCQKKGCWMMLIDGEQAVRVMFGKDDFFIPMDSVGKAVVRGRLQQVEMSQAHAEHMAEDGGGDVDSAKAGVEWRIVAVSVLIEAEA